MGSTSSKKQNEQKRHAKRKKQSLSRKGRSEASTISSEARLSNVENSQQNLETRSSLFANIDDKPKPKSIVTNLSTGEEEGFEKGISGQKSYHHTVDSITLQTNVLLKAEEEVDVPKDHRKYTIDELLYTRADDETTLISEAADMPKVKSQPKSFRYRSLSFPSNVDDEIESELIEADRLKLNEEDYRKGDSDASSETVITSHRIGDTRESLSVPAFEDMVLLTGEDRQQYAERQKGKGTARRALSMSAIGGEEDKVEPAPTSFEYFILSEKFLHRVAKDIGSEWWTFFISIHLTEAELKLVEKEIRYNTETKILKAFLVWRKKFEDLSAAEQLKILIRGFLDNQRKDLAEKYEKYLGGSDLQQIAVENKEKIRYEKFKEQLKKRNYAESCRAKTFPVDINKIYAPLVFLEDFQYKSNERTSDRANDLEPMGTPEDIFYEDGELVRNIFILGEVGYGKSVFCRKLLKDWCNGTNPESTASEGSCEEVLARFDFLFFLKMKDVDPLSKSLIQMICLDRHEQQWHDIIHEIISSEKYRCLVVVDGLDEWMKYKEAKSGIKSNRLPSIENMTKCTILWTLRSSLFADINHIVCDSDKVFTIEGLNGKARKILIQKLQSNFRELSKDPSLYSVIEDNLQDARLDSLMRIPLLAVACVRFLHGRKGFDFKALFEALIEQLIKTAIKEGRISEEAKKQFRYHTEKHIDSKIMWKNGCVKDFIVPLEKIGKFAYEKLLEKEKNFVFQKEDLKHIVGEEELEFASKVGLLSLCNVTNIFDEETVSVNFLDESIKECLAATYVVTNKDISESFHFALSSIQNILEMRNIIIFISGFDPHFGWNILKCILNLTQSDASFCRYRETVHEDYFDTVEQIYNLQISCFRIMGRSQTGDNATSITHFVWDVHVGSLIDNRIVNETVDILENHCEIRSLYLENCVGTCENYIEDEILTNFLDRSNTLQSLTIWKSSGLILNKISDRFSLLTTLVLFSVTLTKDSIRKLKTALQSNNNLKTLGLMRICCKDEYAPLSGLIEILPDLSSLSNLYIHLQENKDILMFFHVLSRLSHLETFHYLGSDEASDFVDDEELSMIEENSEHSYDIQDDNIHNDDMSRTGSVAFEVRSCDDDRHESESRNDDSDSKICSDGDNVSYINDDELNLSDETRNDSVQSELESVRDHSIYTEIKSFLLTEFAKWSRLRALEIDFVDFADSALCLTPNMEQIEEVRLENVNMTSKSWYAFIQSLINMERMLRIVLYYTNINDENETYILSSPHFTVKEDDNDGTLIFTRDWPPTSSNA